MQGVDWMKVKLLPHDPEWDAEFLRVKARIERVWRGNVLDVQHVGSTAVPSICAKPILDVAVTLHSFNDMDVSAMERLGYEYMGARTDSGDRRLFIRWGKGVNSERKAFEHVHCYEPGNEDCRLLIGFRDYLNAYPQAAAEYDALKRALAERYPDDRYAYSAGKMDFIMSAYARIANES